MKKGLSVIGLTALLMATPVLLVQAEEKKADQLAVEGLTKLLSALSVFIDSIPQFETPEILENGDIIIRRKPTEEKDKAKDGVEKTSM